MAENNDSRLVARARCGPNGGLIWTFPEEPFPDRCPYCGSTDVRPLKPGTQEAVGG